MFFSFDGLDGVGKTTQLKLFCEWLRASGHDLVTCHDPGSTALGEKIRAIVLGEKIAGIAPTAEMLLFMAARAQLVEEVIEPAMAEGKTIVSDRYLLANVVYQGHAGGLNVESLWQIGRVATHCIMPDLTFVLDMSPEAARARINRNLDRMETRSAEFQARLRVGFLTEAARAPEKIAIIDASRSIEQVQAEVRELAGRVFSRG